MPQLINTPIPEMWEARKRLKISQRALAAMIEPPVSQATISDWEAGRAWIPPARAAQLEALLEITLPNQAFQSGEHPE